MELWFGHGCSGHHMLLEHEQKCDLGMDALVTVCFWNTNVTMVWAWMQRSPYALGTRTELWFGHGCSGHRMLLEHERNYGLGMDALVTVCSSNTNGIMVWAWMQWSPYAFGAKTELRFGHGCNGHHMLLEHEQKYDLGMDALVTVCFWNTNVIMVWVWMQRSPYALGTRTELWFGHGCSGHRMLLEHERNYGLGMDALVTVCSSNTSRIMVWAWMQWSPYAFGAKTELRFGHGCKGHRMFFKHELNYCLGMDAVVTAFFGTRTELWLGHGCSGHRIFWNTNGIMVCAWMLWSPYALVTRTELWFGHGCNGHRMLLEHARNFCLGMDALVTVCSWITNSSMV